MISGLGNANGATYTQHAALAKKLDADSNGSVSKSEFVDGAPQGVTADAAAKLFDLFDTQKTGAIKDGDLANAFTQFSNATKNLLIQQQDGAGGQLSAGQSRGAALFAKLDANGDGSLTRDEFVAARPKGISEEDASKLFDTIAAAGGATADADSVSETQFAQGVEAQHAKMAEGSHGHGGGGKKDDDEKKFDALDTNKDGVVSLDEFLAGRPADVSAEDAAAQFKKLTDGDGGNALTKDQFVQGMQDAQAQAQQIDPREMLKRVLASLQAQSADSAGQSLDKLIQAINAYKATAQSGLVSSAMTASVTGTAA